MPERVARLGSNFYKDSDGRYRRAAAGDAIQVHPDYVERFDRLNVLAGEERPTEKPVEKPAEKPVTEAPPRRGRPRKSA